MAVTPNTLTTLKHLLGRTKAKLLNADPVSDSMRAATGFDTTELYNMGRKMYPKVAPFSSQHRLASKLMTQRIPGAAGVMAPLSQLAGVGNELYEAYNRKQQEGIPYSESLNSADTKEDLRQNWEGAKEGLSEDWNNFKQLFRR